MKLLSPPARFLSLISALLIFSNFCLADNKNKKTTNRGATEKTITGKVSVHKDRHKFTVSYKIGGLKVGRSSSSKAKEFDGKTVTAKCRIHKGVIVRIYEIEETAKPAKKKKK